jgi:predicted lipoprotein with Yx(FWY)xxD motif
MFKTLAIAASAVTFLVTAGCANMVEPPAKAPAMLSGGALVTPAGMTLYTFDQDVANSGKSACNGGCAALWPPMMATATDRTTGAYSIVTRDDGSRQWAYKGKPVYTYKGRPEGRRPQRRQLQTGLAHHQGMTPVHPPAHPASRGLDPSSTS